MVWGCGPGPGLTWTMALGHALYLLTPGPLGHMMDCPCAWAVLVVFGVHFKSPWAIIRVISPHLKLA